MAEAIVGPLVGKLQDLALSQTKALVAVNGDIRSLRDRLMWMQAFLRHADQRRRNSYDELIRVWTKQIRDAAFDAEDAIDLFMLKVDLSRQWSCTDSIISFLAGCTTQVSIQHNLSIKIAEVNERLDAIVKNKENYMTEHVNKDSAMVPWKPSAIMSTSTTKMDDVQAPLVQRSLLDMKVFAERAQNTKSMKLLVTNVTGECGVGKATVVREVYESMKTQTIFEERVWVSFPPSMSVSNVLQLIHQQLEHQHLDSKNTSYSKKSVETMVEEKLYSKKFLLVIDGELSDSNWMALLNALQTNDKGSMVVRIMQGSPPQPHGIPMSEWISVTCFDQDDTTKFIDHWVPKESKHKTSDNKMPSMGARIHNMTGGLPLAVVLLCGLLNTKEYPNEWDKVLDHLASKQSNRLDNILTMCFDDLPHDLKSCFLYFAILPMNTAIEAHKLICMWMAEGFLRPKDGKSMEGLGKIYLKDLVARNLVKVVKRESFTGGPFVGVHHKVHSFLLLEAQEANFVGVHHNGDDSPPLTNTRRLSLQNYTDKYAALANPLPKLRSILSTFQEENKGQATDKKQKEGETAILVVAQNEKDKDAKDGVAPHRILGSGMLRSLGQNGMTSRHEHIRKMLKESRFLRVINLQGIDIGEELPAAISNASQLQYLGVTDCSLKSIPPVIGELKHLQTLDVRHTEVRVLPRLFWTRKTLRHVFGSDLVLPKRVGNLKYLQTLETIQPDKKHGWDEKTFKEMVNLQSLYLSDSSGDVANVNAICAVISKPELLEYLEKLVLKFSKSEIPMDVFTSPSQRRLRAMSLSGRLIEAEPKADFCVPNLTFLSLKGTKVSKDFINDVGELPLLMDLILEEGSYEGGELNFVYGKKFRSLKRLTLSSLRSLKKLVIGKEALLELKLLVITSYDKGISIYADKDREFVKIIEGEDKDLYDRISQEPDAKEQRPPITKMLHEWCATMLQDIYA